MPDGQVDYSNDLECNLPSETILENLAYLHYFHTQVLQTQFQQQFYLWHLHFQCNFLHIKALHYLLDMDPGWDFNVYLCILIRYTEKHEFFLAASYFGPNTNWVKTLCLIHFGPILSLANYSLTPWSISFWTIPDFEPNYTSAKDTLAQELFCL